MLDTLTSRADLERDLRLAIHNEEFELHYQLQVADPMRAVGAEVLVRWRHPVKGLVSPLQFIAAAEETGLIVPLGLWVLRAACLQLKRWENAPQRAHLQLSVNVSARQFHHPDFVEQIAQAVLASGVDARQLKLELTESLLVTDLDLTIAKMSALKDLGLGFALDDFGTGYSSLSYLRRLPVHILKIDQSFVRTMLTDAEDLAIVRSVIALASVFRRDAIAEGIETPEHMAALRAQGCRYGQGYWYARPMPTDDLERFVRERTVARAASN
jgi:EAL domain-containing protein (putative c-di-GMP-specific phosphodiesterase class I)